MNEPKQKQTMQHELKLTTHPLLTIFLTWKQKKQHEHITLDIYSPEENWIVQLKICRISSSNSLVISLW